MIYDVVVVLAGGIQDDNSLPLSVQQRIDRAYQLYNSRKVAKIIMSGKWSFYREKERLIPSITEAEAMKRYAMKLGIPENLILKEEHSHTTQENAHYVKKLFLIPYHWQRVCVISSGFHISRVKKIFLRVLDSYYQVEFIGVNHSSSLLKKVLWFLRESSLYRLLPISARYDIQRFINHFFYCT